MGAACPPWGVRQDGAGHDLRVPELPQDLDALPGVLLLRGELLVVEVVQQRRHAPQGLVFPEAPGIAADGRVHRVGMAAQALALGVLVQQGEGGIAIRCPAHARPLPRARRYTGTPASTITSPGQVVAGR